MIIKILGSGCKKCVTLTENTQQALHNLGLTADVVKVTDFAEIAAHGVMSTPALAIDDKVYRWARCSRQPRSPTCCAPAETRGQGAQQGCRGGPYWVAAASAFIPSLGSSSRGVQGLLPDSRRRQDGGC